MTIADHRFPATGPPECAQVEFGMLLGFEQPQTTNWAGGVYESKWMHMVPVCHPLCTQIIESAASDCCFWDNNHCQIATNSFSAVVSSDQLPGFSWQFSRPPPIKAASFGTFCGAKNIRSSDCCWLCYGWIGRPQFRGLLATYRGGTYLFFFLLVPSI